MHPEPSLINPASNGLSCAIGRLAFYQTAGTSSPEDLLILNQAVNLRRILLEVTAGSSTALALPCQAHGHLQRWEATQQC